MKHVQKPALQYLAEFRRFYGGEFRSALYPTRDRCIPFREFWAFYGCIGATQALERINAFRPIATALACSFGKKDEPLLPALRADLVAAYLAAPDPAEPSRIEVVSR